MLPEGLQQGGALEDDHDVALEVHGDELVEEGDVVAGVVAVPHGQEDEGAELTRDPGVQFNRNKFGLSFGLKNHSFFGLRFPYTKKMVKT